MNITFPIRLTRFDFHHFESFNVVFSDSNWISLRLMTTGSNGVKADFAPPYEIVKIFFAKFFEKLKVVFRSVD